MWLDTWKSEKSIPAADKAYSKDRYTGNQLTLNKIVIPS